MNFQHQRHAVELLDAAVSALRQFVAAKYHQAAESQYNCLDLLADLQRLQVEYVGRLESLEKQEAKGGAE
jgi:hypothetical protein